MEQRLKRTVESFDEAGVDARIDNSGALDAGIEQFVAALRRIAASV